MTMSVMKMNNPHMTPAWMCETKNHFHLYYRRPHTFLWMKPVNLVSRTFWFRGPDFWVVKPDKSFWPETQCSLDLWSSPCKHNFSSFRSAWSNDWWTLTCTREMQEAYLIQDTWFNWRKITDLILNCSRSLMSYSTKIVLSPVLILLELIRWVVGRTCQIQGFPWSFSLFTSLIHVLVDPLPSWTRWKSLKLFNGLKNSWGAATIWDP